MPRVLVAPDKFKGSLPASGVAEAVAAGVRRHRPDAEILTLPVADGGDGTLEAALANGFERVDVVVSGPTGEPVSTAYARRGDTAVVEMADACGLSRLPGGTLQPLTASSRGLGEAVAFALDAGCRDIVIGIGGSASTDGGAGLVSALATSPGRTIAIGELGGIWSGELTIDEVRVGDDRGTWLTARGVKVDWSPLRLLGATFAADRIFAEGVEVARLPEGGGDREAGGTLPVSLELRDIDLPHVALGPEFSGGLEMEPVLELVESYREMANGVTEIYLMDNANRTNQVMKTLAIVTAFFMPLSFLTGIYGMNFETSVGNMPELGWPHGYIYFWCVAATIVTGLYVWMKRKGWF